MENRDGSCKVFFHVPHFVDHQSAARKSVTVLSLHISNIYAKKKGIAKKLILTLLAIMISQEVDQVAGDFNGTAWRCSNRSNISTLDEAFADCALPTPPGPTPLWGAESIPHNWADVCGFLKPPGSDRYCKVRMHGAFSIPTQSPWSTSKRSNWPSRDMAPPGFR